MRVSEICVKRIRVNQGAFQKGSKFKINLENDCCQIFWFWVYLEIVVEIVILKNSQPKIVIMGRF